MWRLLLLTLVGLVLAQDSVLLRDVRTLTLHAGAVTSSRRTSPMPQLSCSGEPCHAHAPRVVQCENRGVDTAGAVQWRCEADLDASVRFGRTEVSCEGYARAGDPVVLVGSCGLEYTLETTRVTDSQRYVPPPPPATGAGTGALIWTLAILVVLFMLFLACCAAHEPPPLPPQAIVYAAPHVQSPAPSVVYAAPGVVYAAPVVVQQTPYVNPSRWGWWRPTYSEGVRDGVALARPVASAPSSSSSSPRAAYATTRTR